MKAGIPPEEIQIRLQALTVISSYANALASVATSTDVETLQSASNTLKTDVNGLSTTVQSLTVKRSQIASATKGSNLDLGGPVSSLVTLVGTFAIEHMQRKELEEAIIKGDEPIGTMIDLLKKDLGALTLADESSYSAMQNGMVKIYNDTRDKAAPKELIALIDQFVADNNRIQTLRALQIDSLLSDMKNSHTALVVFAKSSKQPKDLADLASQIDVFTAHAKLFDDAISSIETSAHSLK